MASVSDGTELPKTKGSKGLLAGLALAALLGAGGFYAVFSGLVLGDRMEPSTDEVAGVAESDGPETPVLSGPTVPASVSDVSFLPVEPIVVSLAGPESGRHLRFRADLEVPTAVADEVEHLMPRVVDVMNAYLRSVDPANLSSPGALVMLRAQILRRIGLVIGAERVNDVLVMEFVLS